MANEKELNPSPKFPVGEKPELSPNPNFSDGLENKTNERANTQIVNESKVQPIKDLTIQQIIELIQKYAPGFDPSSVEAGTLVNALGLDEDGLLKKQALAGLFDGLYVRIMPAPESTTLSDEQIEIIKDGVHIEGEFLGVINPLFFANKGNAGVFMGCEESVNVFKIYAYSINPTTKVISKTFSEAFATFNLTGRGGLSLDSKIINIFHLYSLNGKVYPQSYPANSNVAPFIFRKGTLEYYIPVTQDNITSGDTIALDSDLGKALIDHLDVVINGYMARYEYTSGNYIVYSSKTEADGGLKLQVNMISYNTTNGDLSFNQMTFTPDN